jgi:hypothetical protein
MSRARRAVSWLLSPFAYATARVALASRCRVLAGPFAGMRYPPGFVVRQLFGGPYQVGSFELELHPVVERIAAAGPAAIVNVGSAEGYYAVGLALRLPLARVIAFELDPGLRAAAAELAALNEVADRVELRGLCTVAELAGAHPRQAPGATAVIMDCEGAESDLADPERVPWLVGATLVIELHPAIDAEVRTRLEARLTGSHELELVTTEIRRASRFDAVLRPIRGLRRIDRELLVAEFRDGPQDWLVATPREAH